MTVLNSSFHLFFTKGVDWFCPVLNGRTWQWQLLKQNPKQPAGYSESPDSGNETLNSVPPQSSCALMFFQQEEQWCGMFGRQWGGVEGETDLQLFHQGFCQTPQKYPTRCWLPGRNAGWLRWQTPHVAKRQVHYTQHPANFHWETHRRYSSLW